MKSTNDKKIVRGILLSTMILLVLVGVSYAVTWADDLVNEPVDVTASTAQLKLVYKDCGSENASDCAEISRDLAPGESVSKTFSIRNAGTAEAKYAIYFRELVNTFQKDELVYKLENLSTNQVLVENVPVPTSPLEDSILGEISIGVGETVDYKLTVTFLSVEADQWYNLNAEYSLKLGVREKNPMPLLSTILDKANDASITDYNSGNKGEMFVFDHAATGQVSTWTAGELRDYRYIGSSPNNYITFNDETWKIIGVFTVETNNGSKEQLVKIIRDESIGSLQWNSTQVDGAYTNEWTNGSLHTLLNSGDYYNQTGSYTSSSSNKGLSTTARSQIVKVKFYLGSSTTYQNLGGPDYYNFERGTTTCATEGNCSGQTRETSIMQSVGLMYPSDYIYTYANGVDETCYNNGYNCKTSASGTPSNGWLFNSTYYQWLQSPSANDAYDADGSADAFRASSVGFVFGYTRVGGGGSGVRPTVYLASDILIEGTGTQGDPYRIKTSS